MNLAKNLSQGSDAIKRTLGTYQFLLMDFFCLSSSLTFDEMPRTKVKKVYRKAWLKVTENTLSFKDIRSIQ